MSLVDCNSSHNQCFIHAHTREHNHEFMFKNRTETDRSVSNVYAMNGSLRRLSFTFSSDDFTTLRIPSTSTRTLLLGGFSKSCSPPSCKKLVFTAAAADAGRACTSHDYVVDDAAHDISSKNLRGKVKYPGCKHNVPF